MSSGRLHGPLTRTGGAHIVLRSKTPDLVRQEFWGFLLGHFAVRGLMHEAALAADEDPDRLSFTHAVRVIRRKLPQLAAFPPLGGGRGFMRPCSKKSWRNEWSPAAAGTSCAGSNAR